MSERRSTRCSAPTRISTLLLFCATMVISAHAQTFTKLADLNGTTGKEPLSALTQGFDGNLYGTTTAAGAFSRGTFFQITPSGTVTTLYSFCLNSVSSCPDGAIPQGAVALGPDGNFYGTTDGAGNIRNSFGTVYQMTPAGSLTTLHHFCSTANCQDGWNAPGGLTLAQNGSFYGVTAGGPDTGHAFRISTSGAFATVLVVCPGHTCASDAGLLGTLLQARGGYLVGPAPGGANNVGAIYRMTPSGTPTIIYSFCDDTICHDGIGGLVSPPLVQTAGGNILGTAGYGGSGANCTVSTQGCGAAFRVTAAGGGTLTKLHDFCSFAHCSDGAVPGPLIQATDGNFYGTAALGGSAKGYGTVFKLTPAGQYSVIHTFIGTDGQDPSTALFQATDGNLYGTTFQGGASSGGTIFRISLGLAPFVKTVQPAGKVSDSIVILGNNLTGSTSVTFNGMAGTFSVVSDTEITATVPPGATTGTIQVVTLSSTLSSNVAFTVLP